MASQITSLTQPLIQAQIKENIKAPRHWPLCGESTGDRWIPRTNGQYRRKCIYLMTSLWHQTSYIIISKKSDASNRKSEYIFRFLFWFLLMICLYSLKPNIDQKYDRLDLWSFGIVIITLFRQSSVGITRFNLSRHHICHSHESSRR